MDNEKHTEWNNSRQYTTKGKLVYAQSIQKLSKLKQREKKTKKELTDHWWPVKKIKHPNKYPIGVLNGGEVNDKSY